MSQRGVTLLAHGLGGSTDLPIPYSYALIGAAWALTLTFAVVAFAWRTPRFDPDRPGRPLSGWVTRAVDSPITRSVVAGLALALAVWVIVVAIVGPQDAGNALPGAFYVLLWVGVPTLSVLIGPVWRAISPLRTIRRVLPVRALRTYPDALGYWPSAAGLFAFVWLELASPDPGSLTAIKIWLACYVVITLGGALLCGPRWLSRADPFDVYSVVASRLAVFGRNRMSGQIAVVNPFNHLRTLPVRPGTLAVLAVLLGSTAFDSFSASPDWRNFADGLGINTAVTRSIGLLVFVLVVAATFWGAAQATGGIDRARRRELPGLMAHSLIPIVVGYVFAHYLSYLVEKGQQAVITLFGLHDAEVAYVLSAHPAVLATLKVCFVVAGHIGGVIAAHDAAIRLLPKGHQITGQLTMMLTMVAYTFTGLYLLFGG
ncbi:hypothetical protein H7J51_25315 [Mycobacterium crocinum]|uniref:Fenitrothion hydrolase n=1 Tax=Mycolicibacterium crocinum TaxID=388459 RepID=A0ABY3TTE8_9MYCO|nr:hypothetical protein [Mycolicibacterium crocinum]MCV7218583.1 hypothetical protein [Mycolicibacterium crocinum]ULN43917.1 hypothetical protein MI149_13130 [Mycolicibacterium crocinum]